jgi:ferritin-like metal-binding protein YciE
MATSSNNRVRDIFVVGLRNAHAVENQALSIMEPQVARLERYPQMAERLRKHIDETHGQIRRLDEVLGSLSESASSIKDTALSLVGGMASLGHATAGDEILKNAFANFAFENYEIAAYRSLITMAEAAGQNTAVSALRANLSEEENMAKWIEDHLRQVTETYLSLEQQGETAKR